MDLRRYEHPGKFEGGLVIDSAIYHASLDGCCETVGSDDGGESYTSVDAPLPTETDGDPFTPEELAFLANQAGAIIYESSQGFVTVTYYDDKDAYAAAWERVVDSYSADEDDEEPLFSVIEYSSFFAVRHNPTGEEQPMGDGVDTLFDDDAKEALCPGTEGFVKAWEDALNFNPGETLEAYFPDLADDD